MSGHGKPGRGLGRGLDALLPARAATTAPSATLAPSRELFRCPLDKIVPQKGQPRRHFDAKALDELAQSLKEHGLLEPLVVRRRPDTDQLELIAGERRWRAAQRAGLREVLVVVRDSSAKEAFELALIENAQREDLSAIEFAESLARLSAEFGYTQDQLAQRVGKDRSTVANALRLLKLPEAVRERIVHGELSEGHGRALLGVSEPARLQEIADKVLRGRLSVRQTEALVRAARSAQRRPQGAPPAKTPNVRDLEQRLERKLGVRVELRDRGGAGDLLLRYGSLDELDRLIDVLL